MKDGLRLRSGSTKKFTTEVPYASKTTHEKKLEPPNGTQHLFFVLTFFLVLSVTVIVLEKILPEPQLINNEAIQSDRFVAERAKDHVYNLTSMGPRVAGSYANEVLSVRFLKDIITDIQKHAKAHHRVELDVTRHSGAFPLTFLDRMTNVYRNVQNVIVKLGPKRAAENSLLLNCHFDSFSQSPGGSDDAAGCAVMLEILRVMSQSYQVLKHNVIFLFNGAEENILQASHGFITQHKWAKDIRAFINLEACGAGGRELLFQAGPGNPWIIEVYSKVVPYPYASSLAQEIFQSGIVPGETDFRIFRDFGKVSGLDFAWSTNGYVYHTRFDNADQIPLGSLQRTGDNILALTRSIATGPHLPYAQSQKSEGSLVFFDFLGAFVVQWSQRVACLVNLCSIFIGMFSIYLNIKSARKESKRTIYVNQLALCILTIVGSWIVSMLSVTVVALLLTKLGKVMSWYARPAWLFFLYICPTVAVSMTFFLKIGEKQRKSVGSAWTLFQLHQDAYSILCMSVLFICIVLEIRSGFITMHWVLFPALGNIIRHNFFDNLRDWRWYCYQLGILTLPYVQSFYLCIGALYLFIPLMGRAGASLNSELVIANMISFMFCLLLSFILPMVLLIKNAERVISVLFGIFLISIGVLILTPLGFPYSGNPLSPAPQRFMILHTLRQYYHPNGTLRHSGTGYWFVNLDINSPHSVSSIVPELKSVVSTVKDCETELYCGLPFLLPVTTFLWKNSWIPAPAPIISNPAKLDVLSKSRKGNTVNLTLSISGPDHLGVMFSPYENVQLKSSSILDEPLLKGPMWNGRETYFVYYSCVYQCEPYNFTLILQTPDSHEGPTVSLALAGHYLHGENQMSKEFKNFLLQFPSWTVITPWTSTFASHEL